MSEEEDRRSRWFKRRNWWPFFGRNIWDLDEVFKEMEEMMQREFQQFYERTPKELVREITLPDGTKVRQWGSFVYGYSMTVGPDGKPQIREFGNLKPRSQFGKPKIDIKKEREPLVDVLETDKEVKVLAELPGVEKKDIKLHGTKNRLTITVNTEQRKYHKEIELPTIVELKQARASYKNGVLEVAFEKKMEEKPKKEFIEID